MNDNPSSLAAQTTEPALPKRIETERLLLRPPTVADAEVVFARYAQDTLVTRYLLWAPHKSIQETRAFLSQSEAAWRDGVAFHWLICHRDNDQLLGAIGLRNLEQQRAEVGYLLARDAWGNGYMSEALRAVIDSSFQSNHITRIWATCDVENVDSLKVLQNAGMRQEGRLRRHAVHPNLEKQPRDSLIYAIVK